MFTKQKKVGQGEYRVYRKVVDWGSVLGVLFVVGLILAAISG